MIPPRMFCNFCFRKRPVKHRFIEDGRPKYACHDCTIEEKARREKEAANPNPAKDS